ncbi:MAG: LPS-assembly protein LptD [Treponema sp.]|jgi:lipopolysaccharide assembly outer membrane protein LptD (OstA)|nr:LPS-assembly protein LptD [Treponema sp.]
MSLFIAALYAQEEQPPLDESAADELAEEENQEEQIVDSHLNRRIEMEIKTSTLSELAAWCRTLGLSEGGTRDDLSGRLREHFNLSEPKSDNDDKRKIIIIESAQSSEYFTIEVIDEDYARLKGEVRITLKDGDKTHRISADEILFNRTRDIITASGNVIYEKIEADKTETFRGKSITVNIDNWSSIFLDGSSTMENEGSSYLFSGSVISRTDQDVTILRKAMITNGADDNAYWSIRASKLWLLPGSDFAIFNAVLNVGEIPVLYIPFFYFPADEVVFHPVIGYRSREGGFVQTTTYLIGQPKAETSEKSSLSRIIGNSNDKEKELQGLFLRSTSRPIADKNSASLKALLDYYVNLGTYFGLELTTPKTGILDQIGLSLGTGFTRTISETSFGFSPYAPNYDGTFEWNESNFLSWSVPFRYRMKFTSGISMKYGSLSWTIPYYSDPYIDRDFMTRAESMDWMNMIQQGASFEETASEKSEIPPYQWQMSGNFNPSLPILSPFISNISISSISTILSFKTMQDNVVYSANPYSPNRYFYAPDRYTIYSISGSVSGTPVSVGGGQPNTDKTSDPKSPDDPRNDPFNGIGVPNPPWTADDTSQKKPASAEILIPPVLSQTFSLPAAGNTKFSVDYTISPTSSSELQFMSRNWNTYEDVDWNESQSILTSVGGNTNLNFRVDHSTGLFSNTITLSGSGTWREYSYLNEEMYREMYTDPVTGVVNEQKVKEEMENTRRQQYSQTNYASSYSYNGTLKPFYSDPVFAQTNFQYSFRGTLVKSKRYTDGDGPELTPEWGSWVKEERKDGEDILGLSSNRVTANLAAKIINKDQNISVSAELPPLDGLIIANATFRAWITETYFNYRMEKPETEEEWQIKPFDIRETLRFGKAGSFTHNMIFTPDEDNRLTNLRSTLTLWDFKVDYSMIWTTKSVFKPFDSDNPHEGGQWEREGDSDLLPKDLIFSYNHSFPSMKIINDNFNLSLNLNTSVNFDLQQHTNSNFQFTMSLNMGITNFLDLKISASSQNATIFRYFKGVPGMEDLTSMYTEGEQNNLFVDLFDSFNFFDESKRRRSGFKMQRFSLELLHHLGDWTASFEISMYPYQRPGQAGEIPSINIISDIKLLVQWKPITEIKSDINFDGKNERWTVK